MDRKTKWHITMRRGGVGSSASESGHAVDVLKVVVAPLSMPPKLKLMMAPVSPVPVSWPLMVLLGLMTLAADPSTVTVSSPEPPPLLKVDA